MARHAVGDGLFSGWGVRTMATTDAGYNPLSYHDGTVWPHDSAIVAAGLARAGYRDEANTIAVALLEAAATSPAACPRCSPATPARWPAPR